MKNQIELIKRITISLALLLVVEIGKNINIPFFVIEQNQESTSETILSFLGAATGGGFDVPNLFSLGMGPYMTALIIWTTITMVDSEKIKNFSAKQSGYIQRLLTLIIAIIQSIALVFKFEPTIVPIKNSGTSVSLLVLISILILVSGGLMVSWLADLNIENGIGGQSLFVLPGLMSNIPGMLISGQTESIRLNSSFFIGLALVTFIFICVTLFLYNAEYRIKIERTGIDSRFNNSYIPIRMLPAGAMPFMFAVTIFSMPQLFLLNENLTDTAFSNFITIFFSFNSIQGVLTYGAILYGLGYGFSFINVRPSDIAKNLKETGDYILDVVPGEQTEKYIFKRLSMVSLIGNSYLVVVSVIPLLVGLNQPIISNIAFYFGSIFMLLIILESITNEVQFIFSRRTYSIF